MPLSFLSAGEKTKLSLCRLLLADPDLILFDEPTNHLDINMLNWLEEFLLNLSIPYIIISHDRTFLNISTKTIWKIKDNKMEEYSGNYSFYKTFIMIPGSTQNLENKFSREGEIENNIKRQQKKIRQLKQVLSDRKKKQNQ